MSPRAADAVRRALSLVTLLLAVELLDEAYSGVPFLATADIQRHLQASYAETAGVLLFVPTLVALAIEPVLFLLADRYPRKWFVCGGLVAMAVAAWSASLAHGAIALTAALSLAFIGSGSGVALSQATLVDAHRVDGHAPDAPARALARWALWGEVGDLLGPALMAGLAALSVSWRAGFVVVGAVSFLLALLLATKRFPGAPPGDDASEDGGDEDSPSLWTAYRTAVTHGPLMWWLGAAALCELLDEIVVVFAVLHLRDGLGAGPEARSAVMGAGVVGAIAGVALTERLLARMPARRLLWWTSLSCAASYLAWLFAPTVVLSAVLFFVVGLTAAPMYPVASAQAYAALPGRSGTVNAAGHIFTPIILLVPPVLGWVADRYGIMTALALLLLQPLGLAAVAAVGTTTSRGRPE